MYSVFIIYGVFGLDFCGVYETFGLVFSYFFLWRGVALCSVQRLWGIWVGPLWRSQLL